MEQITPAFETPIFPNKKIGTAIVLGAGPTGLSTAWRLAKHGWKVTVIEKKSELGGHGGTAKIHGYDVDDGPHKLYPQVRCAKPLIDHFVGSDLLTMSKKSTIYLNGKYIPFPFGLVDLFKGLGIFTGIRCGVAYVFGKIESLLRGKPKTYTDFIHATYGRYPHKIVFRPIATKLWSDPDNLDVQLAKTRVIAPSILELLSSLVLGGFKNKSGLSADLFYYPRKGLRQLWEAMGKEIEEMGGVIHRETTPQTIIRNSDQTFDVDIQGTQGTQRIHGDVLVSTIPLKTTYTILQPKTPPEIMSAIQNIQLSSLLILYVVVNAPRVLPVNWIFFPEARFHFARLSEQKGFSEEMVPKDKTIITVEIPFAREYIQKMDHEKLIAESLQQLREVGILKPEHEILETFTGYDESIYPIYNLTYQENLDQILRFSDAIPHFYLNGRLGLFCYNNMDHSMEMGLTLADHIAAGESTEDWQKKRQLFYEYKIVD